MTNKEAAVEIRKWLLGRKDIFSWPTDGCGYEQHIRFVNHRNKNWIGDGDFDKFVSDYADMFEVQETPPQIDRNKLADELDGVTLPLSSIERLKHK